jgi:hypothetical protein
MLELEGLESRMRRRGLVMVEDMETTVGMAEDTANLATGLGTVEAMDQDTEAGMGLDTVEAMDQDTVAGLGLDTVEAMDQDMAAGMAPQDTVLVMVNLNMAVVVDMVEAGALEEGTEVGAMEEDTMADGTKKQRSICFSLPLNDEHGVVFG